MQLGLRRNLSRQWREKALLEGGGSNPLCEQERHFDVHGNIVEVTAFDRSRIKRSATRPIGPGMCRSTDKLGGDYDRDLELSGFLDAWDEREFVTRRHVTSAERAKHQGFALAAVNDVEQDAGFEAGHKV